MKTTEKLADEIIKLFENDFSLDIKRAALIEELNCFGALASQEGWRAACEWEKNQASAKYEYPPSLEDLSDDVVNPSSLYSKDER